MKTKTTGNPTNGMCSGCQFFIGPDKIVDFLGLNWVEKIFYNSFNLSTVACICSRYKQRLRDMVNGNTPALKRCVNDKNKGGLK